jgi:hypothetical protein
MLGLDGNCFCLRIVKIGKSRYLPAIQFMHKTLIDFIQDPKEMNKQSFPSPDFNLVEKVDNKHHKKIHEMAKSVGESVLQWN